MLVAQEKSRTNIYLDTNIKDQAKEIFNQYGLSLSQAVNIFLTQSVLNRGLPYAIIKQNHLKNPLKWFLHLLTKGRAKRA